MYKSQANKEVGLRLTISIVLSILVLLPLVLISADMAGLARLKYHQRLEALQQNVKDEVNRFRENLTPRLYVESIVKAGEKHIGLTSEINQRPIFAQDVDPQLITANTIPELRQFYQQNAQIEPLIMVAFGVDCSKTWSWFNQIAGYNDNDKARLEDSLTYFVADVAKHHAVMQSNPAALTNIDRLFKKLVEGKDGKVSSALQELFYDYFSDMSFVPPYHGTCYEMATTRFASRNVFTYHHVVKDGELVYGGYFVAFAGNQARADKIIAAARKSGNEALVRGFPARVAGKLNQLQTLDDTLFLVTDIPAELAGFNTLSPDSQILPRYMSVSASFSNLRKDYQQTLRQLGSMVRLAALAIFVLSINFTLFGFPALLRLRARMLVTLAMVFLLPYIILGYLCLTILDSINLLSQHELRVEANGLLYRLQSYYTDQKLQLVLQMFKSKDRLMKFVDDDRDSIMQLSPHKIVAPDSFVDLSFFRDDGVNRGIRARNTYNLSSANVNNFLAAKFLDNLGVLQKNRKEVSSLLDKALLADGMLETLRRNYTEHYSLINEGIETRELKKLDDFSRMLYYLIPTPNQAGNPVRAFVMTSVSNSNYILVKPYEFSPGVFSQFTDLGRHEFAIGQRRLDDTLLRCWPAQIGPDAKIKKLLQEAAGKRSNGSSMTEESDGLNYQQFRFLNNDQVVFAGLSTADPDLLLQFLVQIFPFLLLIVALSSLYLSGDILSVLFISPVKGFNQAASKIGAGQFQISVGIEKTDEFSLLADSFNRMALGLVQREKMRRFVSENLYEQLGKQAVDAPPRVSQVTLLACDIRGFTTLSEKHEPQQIVSLLNDYFTEMEAAITSCGGFVERLVGDAVVAVFYQGAAEGSEQRAASAALLMREKLAGLNRLRTASGLFTIENGIGIATGQAFSGMAGDHAGRRIFSVIGGVTRLAEKLEAATRLVNSRILLCPVSAAALGNRFIVVAAEAKCGFAAFELRAAEVNHV